MTNLIVNLQIWIYYTLQKFIGISFRCAILDYIWQNIQPDPFFPPNDPLDWGMPRYGGAMDRHGGVYNPTCTYTHRQNNHAELLFSMVWSVPCCTSVLHLNSPFPPRLFFLGTRVRISLKSHFSCSVSSGSRVCPIPVDQWTDKGLSTQSPDGWKTWTGRYLVHAHWKWCSIHMIHSISFPPFGTIKW